MSIILGIILLVVLLKYDELQRENNNLKRNRINYCPKCGHKLNNDVPVHNCDNEQLPVETPNKSVNTNTNVIVNTPKKVEKPKMSDEEIKNNIILITGSILIILAAIIFLTTSWTSTSNILKCLVIFILFIVFITASYIAKEKLSLTQTAKAFKYIALAYLPISLISLSIFSLLGESFSINGEFQNLYYAITLFISATIYYIEASKDKDKFLSVLSIITSILGIIFLVNVFTSSLLVVIVFLYLYSYFLALLYENKIYLYDDKFTKTTIQVLFYILLSLTGLGAIVESLSTNTFDILMVIVTIVETIILAIYLKNNKLNKYLIPISIIFIFAYLGNLFKASCTMESESIIRSLILLLSIPVIYLYNYIKEKSINIYNFLLSTALISQVFLFNFYLRVDYYDTNIILPLYVISLLYIVLLLVTYRLSNVLKKAIIWLIPICIEFTTIVLILEKDLPINILLSISVLLIISSLIPKLNKYHKELVIVPSAINIIIASIAYQNKSIITFLLLLLSIVVYYLIINKINKNYKYLLYVYINLGLMYLGYIVCGGLNAYTMAISLIIIIALEAIDERLKDDNNFIYILIDFFVTAFYLTVVDKRTAFIMTIVISVVLISYLVDNKKKIEYFIIPLLTPIIYIGFSNVMVFNNINFMIPISILIISVVTLLPFKDKIFKNLVYVPYAYIVVMLFNDISLYIPLIIGLIVSIIYYFIYNKSKVFKVIIMLFYILTYYQILYDLHLDLTVLKVGILLIYSLIITRDLMKDVKDNIVVEYILFILFNLLAITFYTNEADGMLYVVFLIILTIYTYYKKYGPAFLMTILFILVNMFLLTRMFWLSLPWWIYVLGVGIILILFAVLNEISEKDNIKDKISYLLENLKK